MMDDGGPSSSSAANLAEEGRYAESFINFVRDIRKHLRDDKNIDLPLEFVINIVKLASIDSNNKFLIKLQMVPNEVNRLRKIVTERIIGMSDISRSLIKLQLHFREKWMSREKVISNYREEIDKKITPLMDDMKASIPRHLRHYDLYYTKLLAAIIHYAQMGPETEKSVVHETQDIMETIFHKNDISLFTSMSPKDRETELMQIMNITVGVRFYTKATSSSGYGEFIEDLPNVLPKKLQDGLQQLQSMKSLNTGRLVKYTTAIQKYFLKHFVMRAGRREVSLGMVNARQGLSMVHQILLYSKNITEELSNEDKHVQQLLSHYNSILKNLSEQNRKSTTSSRAVVFPKYIELCECWQNILDSNIFVNMLMGISMELVELSEKELLPMDEFIDDLIKALNTKVPSEEDFLNFPQVQIDLDDGTHGLKKIEYRGDVDPSHMNFSGFCVNSLVKGAGMLILANPNLGIFTWKNMNFMFSTPEAATEFSKNPGVVVKRAVAIARRWPELIILLNIETEAYDANAQNEVDGYRKSFAGLLVSKSSGMQCETHPIPSNIVEPYTWNEWELRRRGIILSKIHKRRTHSTQTHWQALKKTTGCQTYAMHNQEAQTNRNVHTSVPQTKFYFAGLRGYHCGMPPHIVELTSETPEDLHCVCKPNEQDELELFLHAEKDNPIAL